MEIHNRIESGSHIAILPTGGTEQEGPQLVTGTHNVVVRYAAGEIAKELGNALVAPVIAYTPSGRIDPPEGHMMFPGTLSVSDDTYRMLLEDAVRSLKQNGFTLICLIGDGKGGQAIQDQVAEKLSVEWINDRVRVLHVSNYYAKNGQEEWNDKAKLKVIKPEAHAGHVDTSEMMAIDPADVRDSMRAVHTERDYSTTGAMGDSSLASAKYGRRYLRLKIDAAVKQIQNASSHER